MTLNRGITVLGTFATAAAVTAVAAAAPAQASADTFPSYTGQATANLNVRTTPDTSHAILGTLKKGETFEVIGAVEGGNWLKISYQNKEAYVDGDYVTKKGTATKATQAVEKVSAYPAVTTANLNVRFLPTSSGSVLATLKKGTQVTVTGKTADGWLQIRYKSGSAYVAGKYTSTVSAGSISKDITTSVTSTNYTGKTTANLNVRRGASTGYSIVTTLKNGTQLNVVAVSGSWLKVNQNGVSGWVSSKYVTKNSSSSTSSGSNSSATVQYTGKTTANLNVRSGASVSASILTTLKKDSSVSVTGSNGNWLQIEYKNGTAWVAKDYVSKSGTADSSQTATASKVLYQRVTTAKLNVRKSASISSSILTTLAKGTTVDVTGTRGNWLQIKYNGGTAYVSADFVAAPQSTEAQSSNSGSKAVQAVITTAVRFREGPSTSAKIYRTLSSGTLVEWLAETTDGWVKVSYGGKDGYVYGDYIEKQTASSISAENSASVKIPYSVSFASALAKEEKVSNASAAVIAEYMNPNNFAIGTSAYYQFLKLSTTVNVDAGTLNKLLAGRGTLDGQGQAFLDAAQYSKVNVFYLIAHAILETGSGRSDLAQGVAVGGTKVYNMFGISAFDGTAVVSASNYASEKGWTSPAAAIKGGAQWIASHYIYRSDYQQDTLYKMRWNPVALESGSAAHQYATDVAWAVKQTSMMNNLYSSVSGANLVFEVPQYTN